MTDFPSTLDLFRSGLRARMAKHDEEEVAKVGTLRGGNSGIFIDDSTIGGKCHRISVLRYLGVTVPKTPQETADWELRQLMFEAGHSNEDNWAAVLGASPLLHEQGLILLREEEYPSHWVLKHRGKEYPVTGRPDGVLGRRVVEARDVVRFAPHRGLEHKADSSVHSFVGRLFGGQPALDHLCQAGHYLMALGLQEYELWYTCRVDFHAQHFLERWPDSPNHPMARYVEFGWYKDKKTGRNTQKPKKGKPCINGYALRFTEDGTLEYKHLTAEACGMPAPWVASAVTKDRIVDYYRYIVDTAEMKDMGPRGKALKADGSKGFYDACDYCDLQKQCIAGERLGFDGWVQLVKDRATKSVGGSSPSVTPDVSGGLVYGGVVSGQISGQGPGGQTIPKQASDGGKKPVPAKRKTAPVWRRSR